MRLTVLGSSCSIPRPGRACSSYLFEFGDTALVADLGSGSFANLIAYRPLAQINALVISHMHADHFLDVVQMRYALKYGDVRRAERLPLYLPPGGEAMLRSLTAAFHPETGDDFLGSVFDVRTYAPDAALAFNGVTLTFAATTHYIPTFAMRFEGSGRSIAYSSDTAPDARVVQLARGAGLFVCEASLSSSGEAELPRGHCSAREAGRMAHDAKVKRLVISHYPASLEVSELERDARGEFSGSVDVADDGSAFDL